MRHWIFNITAALSLLLMLATAGLWVDSWDHHISAGYYADGAVGRFSNNQIWYYPAGKCVESIPLGLRFRKSPSIDFDIMKNRGLLFSRYRHTAAWPVYFTKMKPGSRSSIYSDWEQFGFRFHSWTQGWIMVIPYWFLILIFATLPGIWLYKWNYRRKLGPNACPGCGYDLTGNESGECPECRASIGTEVTQA